VKRGRVTFDDVFEARWLGKKEELLAKLEAYLWYCKNRFHSSVPRDDDVRQTLVLTLFEALESFDVGQGTNVGEVHIVRLFMAYLNSQILAAMQQHVRSHYKRAWLLPDNEEGRSPLANMSSKGFESISKQAYCLECKRFLVTGAVRGLCKTCDRQRYRMKKKFGSMGACARCGHVLRSKQGGEGFQPWCQCCGFDPLLERSEHNV